MPKETEIKKLEHEYDYVKKDEYILIIEEITKILYSDFCQLQNNSSSCALVEKQNHLTKVA